MQRLDVQEVIQRWRAIQKEDCERKKGREKERERERERGMNSEFANLPAEA